MWEFYLATSEIGFRHTRHTVFQLQLAKKSGANARALSYIETTEHKLESRSR
jgi:hypothetical protein